MKRYRILKPMTGVASVTCQAGDIVDLTDEQAACLIGMGRAEEYVPDVKKPPVIPKLQEGVAVGDVILDEEGNVIGQTGE